MSSNISLTSLLTINTVATKSSTHETEGSAEFTNAIAAAGVGNGYSPLPSAADMVAEEVKQVHQADGQLNAHQASLQIQALGLGKQEQLQLLLTANQDLKPITPGMNPQEVAENYSQSGMDILSLERSFLAMVQAVHEENFANARMILKDILRKRAATKNKSKVSTNSLLERFVEEMDSALVEHDAQTAQLVLRSFLAHFEGAEGAFVETSA